MPLQDPLGYNAMIFDALRAVVKKTLLQVKEFGMPIDHHFYITFQTMAPQVVLPLYLRQKYPESMTIVLQYQFYNLTITDNAFSVSLSFGGKFETLTVPFAAVVMFSDPEAQLVFNFEPTDPLPSAILPDTLADKNPTEQPEPSQLSASKSTKKTSTAKNSPPAWHGSIALGTKTPFESARPSTETQLPSQQPSPTKQRNKSNLKPIATKTSARVLAFRPKDAPQDDEKPSKTP